jgi:DNA-binding NarL/FixJ family response regulator
MITDKRELLTTRELAVYNLLKTGLLYKEIANELSIGIDTVKKHCKNIYLKLKVRNRTEAAMMQ